MHVCIEVGGKFRQSWHLAKTGVVFCIPNSVSRAGGDDEVTICIVLIADGHSG